ncbi:MAG: N-acetyl-gamma-glutamyl-phosphate reductase [Candidatus Omnitrophota bacterium]
MLKVSVIGATGYAGEELLKILIRHPQAEITNLVAKIEQSCPINKIFPWMTKLLELECKNKIEVEDIAKTSDLIFLALPHRVSMEIAPTFLNLEKKVIDFSADYRLKDPIEYEKWYEVKHKSKEFLRDSVYGLCELKREEIKKTMLLANPGCYPTGIILSCAPFLKSGLVEPELIVDAKSGTSGAGRTASINLLFSEVNENFKAYKVGTHQHTPEIVQELEEVYQDKIGLTFVPHLVPMSRGILSTIYLKLKKNISVFEAVDIARKFYPDEPFVRIKEADEFPQIKDVAYSNFCDIGIKVAGKWLVAVSVIDNLVKGAAGQAVQNMNIMCGFKETTALLK